MRQLKTSLDISLNEVELLTEEQAKCRYNIGRSSLLKISDEIGAVVRIGRKRNYSRKVMDEYFRSKAE